MPNAEDPSVKRVVRHQARSGVGYASSDVVVHRSSKRRILFRPWYIPHKTHPHGLAGKLITQLPSDGNWVDEHELNLDEDAVTALRQAFDEHAAVAASGEKGTLLLFRGADVGMAKDADAGELVGALVRLLHRADVLQRFAEHDLGEEILAALQGSIRLQEFRLAVAQLRELLDGGVVEERFYQEWCTRHSWAFGNAHAEPDAIRRVSRTDDVDILMPRVLTGYRDIVELKRPDHNVLAKDKSRGTYHWSREASQAIGQCHTYIDHLHHDAERGLRDRAEIVAYHPRATIVIGRSVTWPEEVQRALAGLNQRLVGITLMTYDQLLAQGDELIRIFTAERQHQEDPDER